MNNILSKISALAITLLLIDNATAQLPLAYGDAVVTHSPTKHPSLGNCTTVGIVVRTIKTANTSTAPFGLSQNWNTQYMSPIGTKSKNWSYNNWTVDELGTVFGITLDNNTFPNVYVSSTQIYHGAPTYKRLVWRLDGISGINTKVYDFGDATRSLGNLKYCRIGGIENIYVSDWSTGKIQRLTGNSTGTSLWSNPSSFTPNFPGGLVYSPPQPLKILYLPYGLAIRKIGTTYRLYYSKISTYNNGNLPGAYGNNEVYSVALDPSGDFAGSETKESIPSINSGFTVWNGYPQAPANCPGSTAINNVLPVISDMAFTDDGNRMLVGQQSWGPGFGQLAPHNSGVYEFKENAPLFSTSWIFTPNSFPSGNCGSGKNCVGGVSYSNNILKKDSLSFSCDTTVWFTADCIATAPPNPTVYGVQGMRSGGGAITNSLWIDEDDDLGYYDKNDLGDVEVYKKPLECTLCNCGIWESDPTLNGRGIHATLVNINPMTLNYPIQFVQNNVVGIINATHLCNGGCRTAYTWSISNDVSTAVVASGTSLPIDLASYNSSFKCGKYTLTIKAKCGNSDCGSVVIPITIICEPPSCCKSVIDIDLIKQSVFAALNTANPNAYSIANLTYNINFSTAMSEIRVSVEDFELNANSPNCLNCSNRPVTWGNILTANLNGNPMILSGIIAPPTGNSPADYREAVYSTGTPLASGSAGLSIQLSLPAITELSCCEVSAYVCLKFTFKDNQCRECVQMVCGNIKLVPQTIPHDIKSEKIDIKKFEIKHYDDLKQ